MRIIVMSDTHQEYRAAKKLIQLHEEADLFLHCGDGYQECELLQREFPNRKLKWVRGNCDFGCSSEIKLNEIFEAGQARIFMTHGHLYHVKYSLEDLVEAGAAYNANVILYGHTHVASVAYKNGVYVMNPGSLGQPRGGKASYGIVDVTEKEIVCHTAELL